MLRLVFALFMLLCSSLTWAQGTLNNSGYSAAEDQNKQLNLGWNTTRFSGGTAPHVDSATVFNMTLVYPDGITYPNYYAGGGYLQSFDGTNATYTNSYAMLGKDPNTNNYMSSMAPGAMLKIVASQSGNQSGGSVTLNSIPAEVENGTITVAVYQTTDGKTFTAAPGSVVQMYNSHDTSVSTSTPLQPRQSGSNSQVTYWVFGHVASGSSIRPDEQFCEGDPIGETFSVKCIPPNGYSATSTTNVPGRTGIDWFGRVITFIISPTGAFNSNATTAPGGTSLDVGPTTSGTGYTGDGSGQAPGASSSNATNSFLGSFWDTLKADVTAWFTPAPSDLARLSNAWQGLLNYGPFGLASQIKARYDAFAALPYASDDDPNYWVIKTDGSTDWGFALSNLGMASLPAGVKNTSAISQTAPQASDVNSQMYIQMMQSGFDLRPYSGFIIAIRGIMWCSLWSGLLWAGFNYLKPRINI